MTDRAVLPKCREILYEGQGKNSVTKTLIIYIVVLEKVGGLLDGPIHLGAGAQESEYRHSLILKSNRK